MSFQTFKQEKTYLMIKNKAGKLSHVECEIQYAWDYDNCIPDFDYGDKTENDKEMKRFESGELVTIVLRVTAVCHGFSSSDCLGAIFCKASQVETDLLNTASEHDMKNQLCIGLVNEMRESYDTLAKYFE